MGALSKDEKIKSCDPTMIMSDLKRCLVKIHRCMYVCVFFNRKAHDVSGSSIIQTWVRYHFKRPRFSEDRDLHSLSLEAINKSNKTE